MTIFSQNTALQISIRELKANPARAIAMTQAGERVQITSHRRVVAELVKPMPLPPKPVVLSDEEAMQRLLVSGVIAQPATKPMRLGKALVFPPGPNGQTMSDLVLELRGPR